MHPSSGGWHAHAIRGARVAFGSDAAGAHALRYWRTANAVSTQRRHADHWRRFEAFCAARGRQAMPAAAHTVAAYFAALAARFRRTRTGPSARSHKVISAAINRVHKDMGFGAPALADVVKQVKRGIVAEQADMELTRPARTYLPVDALIRILELAETSTDVDLLADAAAVLFAYVTFARKSTSAAVQEQDVYREPRGGLTYSERFFKGRARRTVHRRIFRFAREAFPRVQAAIRRFCALRGRVRATAPCFAPAGERARSPPRQLARILRRIGCVPPPQCYYSWHSLRKAAATHAYALCVRYPTICAYGGWSVASNVAYAYIDALAARDRRARVFFGWLAPPGDDARLGDADDT